MFRGLVGQSPSVVGYRAGLCYILAETGQLEEARRMLDTVAANGFKTIPEDLAWALAMNVLCDSSQLLSHREVAAALYDVVSRYPDQNATSGTGASGGAMARSLGQLATTLERWDDAERHFDYALDLNGTMGHRPALAQTRMNHGQMLLRRDGPGDREKARSLLTQALEAGGEMGMARVAADCERLLATAAAK